MAIIRHFSDTKEEAFELTAIRGMNNAEFKTQFPGVRGLCFDGFQMLVGRAQDNSLRPVTRKIEYKSSPSLHECNSKCLNGKCTGVCECRCGGKNHGRNNWVK